MDQYVSSGYLWYLTIFRPKISVASVDCILIQFRSPFET